MSDNIESRTWSIHDIMILKRTAPFIMLKFIYNQWQYRQKLTQSSKIGREKYHGPFELELDSYSGHYINVSSEMEN